MSSLNREAMKGNILIVDDTPNNLRLLSSMLTQHGYEVRSAINGPVALKAVAAIAPDLILLDIAMPEMDGYAVCHQLKTNPETCDIPIVFLSALGEANNKVKAFQAGGSDYITKPFQMEEVIARVEHQLALRRMQAELQQAKNEALRALEQEKELNRLKSEFTSMISHDFRTPLTSIQGFAELLRYTDADLSPTMRDRYFDKINGAVEHLLNLLDEILLIGCTEAGTIQCQPTLFNLETFCSDLAEALQLGINSHHSIHFSSCGPCQQVRLDQTLLRQILTNLLSNAIKYSPDNTPIEFHLSCQAAIATFCIRDYGIGIPADNLAHLLTPFYRCRNVGSIKGTGLGLAIVKKCVELHQGALHIDSTEGQGTCITVTLPLAPEDLTVPLD